LENLSTKAIGTVAKEVVGLPEGPLYYRRHVSEDLGKAWAPETGVVTIIDGVVVEPLGFSGALRNPLKGFRPGVIAWTEDQSVFHP
jgi:hypothetical protein